jgi:hypothetical protein
MAFLRKPARMSLTTAARSKGTTTSRTEFWGSLTVQS